MNSNTINKDAFRENFIGKLQSQTGLAANEASDRDIYAALAGLARDYMAQKWIATRNLYKNHDARRVYYFSLEFLIGKMLYEYLIRLGIYEIADDVLRELGYDIREIIDIEPDPGLGNGGLGRLAACFMDSLAACGFPGFGMGIRYKYGLFRQKIVNGYQIEEGDDWLLYGSELEYRQLGDAVEVCFGGHIRETEVSGKKYYVQEDCERVLAIPYDIPVMGDGNGIVNTLRLWSAEPCGNFFDFSSFNSGKYASAVAYRQSVRAISDVLYPDDSNYENKLLRLKQEYFFVCAGIESIIRDYIKNGGDIFRFGEKISIHINDTHPALAVPELMRVLIDTFGMDWDTAWNITAQTVSYTNHTIMPEALEKWPVGMYSALLPRIWQITAEIDRRFRIQLEARYPGQHNKIAELAVVSANRVNMANLSIVGSHSVNGVAAVHTRILKERLFADFYAMFPERFNNKTNGITYRRWLIESNPRLTALLRESIGDEFLKYAPALDKITQNNFHTDRVFTEKLRGIKRENKLALCELIRKRCGISVNCDSIFDVQVKRIHAYKRQLLKGLQILDTYFAVKDSGNYDIQPVTFIFGGKSAPGYQYAKTVIKFLNSVADMVNSDKTVDNILKVVYLENYNVSLAQSIFPASDISEQISTASMEASGTGNMKFMMNGAITVGTMDGANIEIAESVGTDNIITFGLSVDEVLRYHSSGGYYSCDAYNANPNLKRIVDSLINGTFKYGSENEFLPIYQSLLQENDCYFVLKDFESYTAACHRAWDIYRYHPDRWFSMSAVNIAKSGRFSSDETIRRYAEDIWKLKSFN